MKTEEHTEPNETRTGDRALRTRRKTAGDPGVKGGISPDSTNEVVALKLLCTFKSGGTPSKNKVAFWGGKYPWVTAKDLKRSILKDSIDQLTEEGFRNAKTAPKDSLFVLVRGMTLFKDVPVCLTGREMAFNQDIKALLPRSGVDPHYLLFFLASKKHELLKYVDSAGHGTGRMNIDLLGRLTIMLPPLAEQKAIADLLSIWDEAIETVEQLIRAKESHLDSCARRLFGIHDNDKRTGWNVVKLETVLVEHGRKSSGCEDVFSVSVHKGLVNQIEHLGRCFSAANTTGYHRVQHGDIVYTKSPTGNFPLGIVKQSHVTEDVIVSPLYGVFSPITFSLGTVLDFYFSSPTRASNYLLPLVQKGAKNTIAISNTTFLSGSLSLPVEEEAQNNIAEFVLTAREEIDRLRLLEEKYKTQKRGLMQKLLTGEWRVSQEMLTNSVKLNPDQGMEASCR